MDTPERICYVPCGLPVDQCACYKHMLSQLPIHPNQVLDPMPREDVKLPPPVGYVSRADYDALLARLEDAEAALESIGRNTCCEGCQEAARVANAALSNRPADLPEEIQVWRSADTLEHVGAWATARYPVEAVTYVRKDDAEAKFHQHGEVQRRNFLHLMSVEAERDDAFTRLAAADAQVGALNAAVEGLIAVLDRNDKKGPIPDFEMVFCWLAAQDVRLAFRFPNHRRAALASAAGGAK